MKTLAAALAAIVLLVSAAAHAGVVMEEEETVTSGAAAKPPATHKRTVMVEGHKEKMVSDNRTMIIDLDKGTMTVLSPADKSYFESPFPPPGGNAMVRQFMAQNFNYKKTGSKRTIAGYKCEDYSSQAKTATGEFSTTACYSTDAPGAADYAAFQKAVADKIAGEQPQPAGKLPQGVPLATHSSRKITSFMMPGMPPAQARGPAQAAWSVPLSASDR
jgi:hypothetical protein